MRTISYFLNTNPPIELILKELSEIHTDKTRLIIPCKCTICTPNIWFNPLGICPVLPDLDIKDLILLGQKLNRSWGYGYIDPLRREARREIGSKLSFNELVNYVESWLRENNVSCK